MKVHGNGKVQGDLRIIKTLAALLVCWNKRQLNILWSLSGIRLKYQPEHATYQAFILHYIQINEIDEVIGEYSALSQGMTVRRSKKLKKLRTWLKIYLMIFSLSEICWESFIFFQDLLKSNQFCTENVLVFLVLTKHHHHS